jgi:hypothetical protein
MAHKGRLWRLAFRRDWNLNLPTNTLGWADRYLAHCTSVHFSGTGGVINGFQFECGPMEEFDDHTLRWQSKPILIGLNVIRLTLKVQINDTKRYVKTMQYDRAGTGIMLALSSPVIDPVEPAGFYSQPIVMVDFWDPGSFDFDPSPVAWTGRPKDWLDPPPH